MPVKSEKLTVSGSFTGVDLAAGAGAAGAAFFAAPFPCPALSPPSRVLSAPSDSASMPNLIARSSLASASPVAVPHRAARAFRFSSSSTSRALRSSGVSAGCCASVLAGAAAPEDGAWLAAPAGAAVVGAVVEGLGGAVDAGVCFAAPAAAAAAFGALSRSSLMNAESARQLLPLKSAALLHCALTRSSPPLRPLLLLLHP